MRDIDMNSLGHATAERSAVKLEAHRQLTEMGNCIYLSVLVCDVK
jgi:hypothetical protein